VKSRGCTDVLCLALFLAFLGGWAFVGFFAYTKGDIDKVSESETKEQMLLSRAARTQSGGGKQIRPHGIII